MQRRELCVIIITIIKCGENMNDSSIYYDLCLFSYFDIPRFIKSMSVAAWIETLLQDETEMARYQHDVFFQSYAEALQASDHERYCDYYIEDYYNDNQKSGVVAYVIVHKEDVYVVFRGSETLDAQTQRTGWQDWQDNFHLFLSVPSEQQMIARTYVENLSIKGKLHLCGHSKGGNLAGFAYLCASADLDEKIVSVVALNAPGYSAAILSPYRERIESDAFSKRLCWIESEHDCISAMFAPLKQPLIVKSAYPLHNITSLFHCHNVYGFVREEGQFVEAKKKHPICEMCGYFTNQVFMKSKKTQIRAVVDTADSYFESGLSLPELYHVLVYHLGQYAKVFDDLSYEEVAVLEFSTLKERLLEAYVHAKLKQLPGMHQQIAAGVQQMIEQLVKNRRFSRSRQSGINKKHTDNRKKKVEKDGQTETGKSDHQ